MKEYKLVTVERQLRADGLPFEKAFTNTIEQIEKEGWQLHTYQAVGHTGDVVSAIHFLLFSREKLPS
jgi:hypothetical protein